ncbi:MAG: succinate dehydrogenase, cytochrome b556 subunit [Candidatus Aminicenantes bacterium]|nr:succinate dehydrogenase, cytochrome b556 subunit [Candidatus Aminicenantes bacterium]NIM84964.1 succinate dehydrogenase, cytochrome b556 subunit [Candidatus Aminicenantes bacterium]NIN24478.1 succinate dehydrogenase, cytochrome b556 subunit [Candidatus Aminicenantes bacterium]NIN48242.1 succinate dehydrogenase, cytochrome b556 subunit [Candidatus Aminicenantes bacterium]NIN91145.1 succinate dehydrogenase, cytochrome b556 subunit [Candidatus Aminicenantes bacterium]
MYKRTKFFDLDYYKFVGSWAWILHRLSGLGLIFYLTLHIWVINTLTLGEETFNEVTAFLNSPLFKLLEVGLWGIILFHAFNGVRIVIVDFFKGSLFHKKLFFVMIAVAFVLWAIGSYLLIAHIKW